MFKTGSFISVFTMAAMIMGCSSDSSETQARTNTVSITNANQCQLLSLDQSQELLVTLPSNPSTGYSWSISHLPSILLELPAPVNVAEKTAQPLLGSEAQTTWRFKATTVGQDKLEMVYNKPWEKNVKPAKTFSCNITVK